MRGSVAIHRCIFEDEIVSYPTKFMVFVYLIIKANHKTVNVNGRIFKRGEHVTSYEIMMKELKLSKQTITNSLKWLKDKNYIEIVPDRGTHVMIRNYDKFQQQSKK